jgi:hypothetical protein
MSSSSIETFVLLATMFLAATVPACAPEDESTSGNGVELLGPCDPREESRCLSDGTGIVACAFNDGYQWAFVRSCSGDTNACYERLIGDGPGYEAECGCKNPGELRCATSEDEAHLAEVCCFEADEPGVDRAGIVDLRSHCGQQKEQLAPLWINYYDTTATCTSDAIPRLCPPFPDLGVECRLDQQGEPYCGCSVPGTKSRQSSCLREPELKWIDAVCNEEGVLEVTER